MNREDRNTAIIVIIVLVVCLISLYAIGSTIFRLISPSLNAITNSLGNSVKVQTTNYNFDVPALPPEQQSDLQSTPVDVQPTTTDTTPAAPAADTNTDTADTSDSAAVIPANYSYNFPVPPANLTDVDTSGGFRDAILTDAQLAGYGTGADTPQVDLFISIPKISIKSPIIQGLSGDDLLDRGFWVYPGSHPIGEGEQILLCHRRYFGPYDPRSCWNLDKIVVGDEIFLQSGTYKVSFRVIGVNIFEAGDPTIYRISDTEKYLKIVTCTPLYSNAQRLVVLAEQI